MARVSQNGATALRGILLLGFAALGCGTEPDDPLCEPTSFTLSITGTVELPGSSEAVVLTRQLAADSLPTGEFDFLAAVLVNGFSTGAASAVVMARSSEPDVNLQLQFGGQTRGQSALLVPGVPTLGLSEGRGPIISAVGAGGLLLRLAGGGYTATGASGNLTIHRAAPLSGQLTAQFEDATARPAALNGQLQVSPVGPGC